MLMAMTIPGLALLIIAVAFADVMYRRITGRTALPWMRGDDDGRSAGAIGLEQFDAVFAAGRQHQFEQQQTVLMYRDEAGDGTPGDVGVDLRSGKATLRKD
ncbi:hypothetical protein IU485_07030 [Nocardia cyriacigeorgica]|nr:hypothetical protein [Nocardia cyriacigeorgica]MBF6288830.1 hypothetical protein [Nocardia cyriacigeorgica]